MASRFSMVRKGYDAAEVDAHMERLEASIEGYQQRENAVSSAIINAEIKASEIVRAAEAEAKEILASIRGELHSLQKMVQSEKKALADFCSEYDQTVKRYFTGSAAEVTAPMREKLMQMEEAIRQAEHIEEQKSIQGTAQQLIGVSSQEACEIPKEPVENVEALRELKPGTEALSVSAEVEQTAEAKVETEGAPPETALAESVQGTEKKGNPEGVQAASAEGDVKKVSKEMEDALKKKTDVIDRIKNYFNES